MNQMVFEAIKVATRMHDGQRRGGTDLPYVIHTIEVARLVELQGFLAEETLAAAVLHDIVEDTFKPEGQEDGHAFITSIFGSRVGGLVRQLTLPVDCQKDYKKKVEFQCRMMREMDNDGRAIKIADKISNVGDLLDDPPKWRPNAIRGYANSSLEVVNACVSHTTDPRVLSLVAAFEIIHGAVVKKYA